MSSTDAALTAAGATAGAGAGAGAGAAPGPYRLLMRTLQASVFKTLVEALKELLIDTEFVFDASGMKVVSVDSRHEVLVHLRLHKFDSYYCEGEVKLGVNLMQLHKLIKTIAASDVLTLFSDREDPNHLGVRIENEAKKHCTTYRLDLLDMSPFVVTCDPLEFSQTVRMPSADFQKYCRDMGSLSDEIEVRRLKDRLVLSCRGAFCRQETEILDGVEHAEGEEIMQGVFTLKHLVHFTKCTNLCPTVDLYLCNDKPLVVEYGVSNMGTIRLVLSPHMPPGA